MTGADKNGLIPKAVQEIIGEYFLKLKTKIEEINNWRHHPFFDTRSTQ